ncbi:flagellar hook protein FlgE [Sporomusaceae bacterium BoRhaA]|uniref:flagellar hook protein FlgE n=1 Tax=Pelorhabdus rhamnosifermentans TaxID=2772457 RepID=UPI001C061D3E|nr:flagellar hook-basal body complex protein [Pelorhabdus rhamnosifermentans]MBU2703567.1 flagellar hook protein FlgE [Pelorhabdus rhamnosifermentans]
MSSAMDSGVSGLKAQQTKLNIIGNNIANISTPGYKSQRATFSDIFSQTIRAATGPSASSGRGGTNPMQIGLGVNVSSINTDMSTGSTQSTGNNRDASIGGDGFFIVKDGNGSEYKFTRAGNFGVDKEGNLTVNGMKVCGWQQYTTDANGKITYNTQTAVQPINVFADGVNGNKKIIPPKASTIGVLSGNLDPTKTARGTSMHNIGVVPSTPDSLTTMTVYDAQGNSYDVQVKMSKCCTDASTGGAATGSVVLANGGYTVTKDTGDQFKLAVDGGAATEITIPPGTYASPSAFVAAVNTAISSVPDLAGKVTAKLTSDGKLSFVSASTGGSSAIVVTDGTNTGAMAAYVGTATATVGVTHTGNTSWFWQAASSSKDMTVGAPSFGYLEFDSNGKLLTTDAANFNAMPNITLRPTGSGPITVKMDMSGISTYMNSGETKVTGGTDGYAAGDLDDFSIGSDGTIIGSYNNGQKQSLGMIALAQFTNSAGLEKVGDNLYTTTTNSGNFTGGVAAGSGGTGSLSAGTLEGSNVDLAEQFSDMMITSRAYQANSKIITTQDTMQETLINMVR